MLLEMRGVWNERGHPPCCLKVPFVCCEGKGQCVIYTYVYMKHFKCGARVNFIHKTIYQCLPCILEIMNVSWWGTVVSWCFRIVDLEICIFDSFLYCKSLWIKKTAAKRPKCKCETQVLSFPAGCLQEESSHCLGSCVSLIMLPYPKMDSEIKIPRNVGAKILSRLSSVAPIHIHVCRETYRRRLLQSYALQDLWGTSFMGLIT